MKLSAYAGNAGEYFTVAQLLRMGWLAALTPRGSRAYDVLAQKDGVKVSLRVKTKTSAARVFQWNRKKTGEIFLDLSATSDFTVLVDVPEAPTQGPTFYIVPTRIINDWLTEAFERWKAAPGVKKPHDENNKRRMMYVDSYSSPPKVSGCRPP